MTIKIRPSLLIFALIAHIHSGIAAQEQVEDSDSGEWSEDTPDRSFLFKELVLSVLYTPDGMMGFPPGDTSVDNFEISPRPPGNYFGVDYVRTFSESSWANRHLPDWLQLAAMDLHPRLVYNRMADAGGFRGAEMNRNSRMLSNGMPNPEKLDIAVLAPQDFWLRFSLGGRERLNLRIGQFVIPYGVNPILAPRQRFMLPLEAVDLGLKWDWGLNLKGPLGEYDWEVAATLGSGEGLHTPILNDRYGRKSFLYTGRIGTPTYRDFQHGLSFLYGDLPVLRSLMKLSEVSISRRRVAYDMFYKHGTYLMAGGQISYGDDGFDDDGRFNFVTGGKPADISGIRVWLDWVLPFYSDLRLAIQYESVERKTRSSQIDDTAVVWELGYSFTNSISAKLNYRREIENALTAEGDIYYLTFVYYGR